MEETRHSGNGERRVTDVVAEIGDELRSFCVTRIEMFKAEVRESVADLKAAMPLVLVAAALLGTAGLLLTLALVALVAMAFMGNPYAWFFSFLIVGGLWLVTGGILTALAMNRLRRHGVIPKKTVQVLKADKEWFEAEVRRAA
jgi:uncharacterized membrane protein YqjE